MTKFNLKAAGSVQSQVYRDNRNDGYRIHLLVRPVMEDMFETFVHNALFQFEADAKGLAELIRDSGEIDMRYWFGPSSPASAYQFDNKGVVLSNERIVSKRYKAILAQAANYD